MQAWHPLKDPVSDSPLAIFDATTLAPHDLIPSTIHFVDRVGQTYLVAYNLEQRSVLNT